jgi:uncharacterized membrane protein
MSGFLLFLMIVALGISLRRAFVRIDYLERELRGMRQPLPQPALPEAARPPQAAVPTEAVLPPEAAASATILGEASSRESRSVPLPAEETAEPESLETRIGSKWLLYVGIIAIVIGVAYFEKLAIDNEWLGETARVIQGGVLGLLLVYGGLRFVHAGYAVYGQMIAGGGAAILYLSTYAAFNFYHLIERPLAVTLMLGITATVAWLADRLRSQGLAVFAVGGGFATPFMLSSTNDAQIALFGYDAILIGAALVLSRRHDWPALNIVSYVFTLLTVAIWADRFYTPEKYLRTELFLTLFCAMFVYILRQDRQANGVGARAARMVLWTAPAAYYIASWIVLADHNTALLVWLVALMLAGGILSERAGSAAGFAVWGLVALPILLWTARHLGPEWHAAGLTTIAAVYVISLAAQLRRTLMADEQPVPLGVADVGWLHLNGLLMFAAAYFLIVGTHLAATGPLAAAFAVWHGLMALFVRTRHRDQALHFAALGFTLMSIAIALQFDGPAVPIGWAAEGAVVIALALRERRQWLRNAGLVLFAVAFVLALSRLGEPRAVAEAVLFNSHAAAAAAVAALCYVLAWLHHRDPEARDRSVAIGGALVLAQFVTLALLTSEIYAYWPLREGRLARELMVSVTWGVYATVLIVVGLRSRYAPLRYFAMAVFAVTTLKVFVSDMAQLERIYRVSSVIGLGILLLLTSYLYNRSKRS